VGFVKGFLFKVRRFETGDLEQQLGEWHREVTRSVRAERPG